MSKLDALRAMREARYAEDQARAAGRPSATRAPVAPPARRTATPAPGTAATAAPPATDERCGHRNMGGKTCTREQGHSAKNHRYS